MSARPQTARYPSRPAAPRAKRVAAPARGRAAARRRAIRRRRIAAILGSAILAGLVGVLRAGGIRHLLIPLPAESHACSLLSPFAAEVVDMNFVVKRLGGSAPVAPGPIYFDIRH